MGTADYFSLADYVSADGNTLNNPTLKITFTDFSNIRGQFRLIFEMQSALGFNLSNTSFTQTLSCNH